MKVHNPFRVAFVATLGVGLGLLLITSIQTLSTILLYVGTALFLSLGLDPIISWLEKRKFPRWAAVLVTILAVLLAFAGIVLMILPILVTQVGQLIKALTTSSGGRDSGQTSRTGSPAPSPTSSSMWSWSRCRTGLSRTPARSPAVCWAPESPCSRGSRARSSC